MAGGASGDRESSLTTVYRSGRNDERCASEARRAEENDHGSFQHERKDRRGRREEQGDEGNRRE
jgi:hypothetical protein